MDPLPDVRVLILPIRLLTCNLCAAHLGSSEELSQHYANHFQPGKCSACADPLIRIRDNIYHLQLETTCTKRQITDPSISKDRSGPSITGIDIKAEPELEKNDVTVGTTQPIGSSGTNSTNPPYWTDYAKDNEATDSDDGEMQMIECVEIKLEDRSGPIQQKETRIKPSSSKPNELTTRKRPFKHRKPSGKPRKKPERRDPRTFECYICKRIINHLPNLRRHITQNHDGRSLTCEICGQKLAAYSYLRGHMKTHSDSKEFICSYCGKGFHHQFNMLAHMVVHTGIKTHKCDQCDKLFGTRSNLLNHLRVHSGEKPYKCKIQGCERAYMYSIDLKRHLYGAHGIYTKKYECKVCGKILPENKLLVAHMKTH